MGQNASTSEKIKNSLYYGKVLLFGEYGIIQDSMGLSIPYQNYRGILRFQANDVTSEHSNQEIFKYLEFLKELNQSPEFTSKMNTQALEDDLQKGLWFESSIPQGFGVGSSGALVAALYDRYAEQKISAKTAASEGKLALLKAELGRMESYFHGKSSGLDPLICYLNFPVLIRSKQELDTVGLPEEGTAGGAIFLLNSGAPGKTQPMVEIFMDKLKNDGFRNMIKTQFKKYNDACIEAFLKGDTQPLFQNLKKLSGLVFENFQPMIPHKFHDLWQKGLETNSYYLKLCGSGGGGYILGFTHDLEAAKKHLSAYPIEVIHRF
jgi:mevalonate kinase